jgi:hypothetical protein
MLQVMMRAEKKQYHQPTAVPAPVREEAMYSHRNQG